MNFESDAPFWKEEIYPTSPREEKAMKEYIDENLAKRLILISESPAGYPVLFEPKKSGEIRRCMDCSKFNQSTKQNTYPIPRISAVFEAMKETVVFSKLDLKSA